jgi:dipeptidase E
MRLYLSSYRLGSRAGELIRLVRGPRAGVIANADDFKESEERARGAERELEDLADLGLQPEEIDLRDHFDTPTDELRQRLASLDLIWVRGGNSFILRRAFRQSGADELIAELLGDDALAYAGYSAGASMLGPSLRGAELVDDPAIVPAGYMREIVWDCLGLIPYKVVPHYRSEHPESEAIEQLIPHLVEEQTPFVALRDGEAIVIDDNREEIVGEASARS